MRDRIPSFLTCVVAAILFSMPAAAAQPSDSGVVSPIPTRCQIGPGLGSSLLFPYFEVDLNDPSGITTLISVNNSPNSAALTRLIMWTDWGIPTMAFDIYLKGIDIQTINVRSLFDGDLPVTGLGADLGGFDDCGAMPPQYGSPALTAGQIEQLRTAHTGQAGHIDGLCYAADHGDGIARGFITVDVVDQCTGLEAYEPLFTPANLCCSYFVDGGGPAGIAVVSNRLWGDIIYVDNANNSAQGSEAISLWADPAVFPGTGTYTFYGRHHSYDTRDERVPLPTTWDQRFLNGGAFDGGAELIVYHEPNSSEAAPIACGTTPSWYPLTSFVGTVDEDADNLVYHSEYHFPLVTQRVPIDTIAPPYDFGWLHVQADDRQMWIQPILTGSGRFSAGFNGTPISFLCGLIPPSN